MFQMLDSELDGGPRPAGVIIIAVIIPWGYPKSTPRLPQGLSFPIKSILSQGLFYGFPQQQLTPLPTPLTDAPRRAVAALVALTFASDYR